MNPQKCDIPIERHSQPEMRRALRVLRMVHELHKAGFQRLRIVPGLAPSGCYWRCTITPASNILKTHGAMMREHTDAARYSTGMQNKYFDWEDAQEDTARALAIKFIERFPEIVKKSFGPDWEYAGWYVEMMGFAERGHLPVAYADWYGDAPDYLAKDGESELSFPPPGEAEPGSNP